MKAPPSKRSSAKRLLKDNRGATMVEYGLLLVVILILAFVAFNNLGKQVRLSADKATMTFS